MKPLEAPSRTFVTLVVLAAAPFVVAILGACSLASVLGWRVSVDGVAAAGDWRLWPGLVFLGAILVAAVLAARSVRAQVEATRRLDARVHTLGRPVPGELASAAVGAGLEGRVVLVAGDEPFSFAYGLWRPTVVVSEGLLAAAPNELAAVLAHERYHVAARDPLKVVFARALPAGFFYLPALGQLRDGYVAARELAADRRAIEACGRRSLAGALYQVVRGPSWPELQVAAAIGGPELLDARITQLETGSEARVEPPSRGALVASVLGVALLAAAVAFTVIASGWLGEMMNRMMGEGDSGMRDGMGGWNVGGMLVLLPGAGLLTWLVLRWVFRRS
jgi:Zn-dependent protease with chaperone function